MWSVKKILQKKTEQNCQEVDDDTSYVSLALYVDYNLLCVFFLPF